MTCLLSQRQQHASPLLLSMLQCSQDISTLIQNNETQKYTKNESKTTAGHNSSVKLLKPCAQSRYTMQQKALLANFSPDDHRTEIHVRWRNTCCKMYTAQHSVASLQQTNLLQDRVPSRCQKWNSLTSHQPCQEVFSDQLGHNGYMHVS